MKGEYLLRGIGGLALSALLLLGVTASSATTANARGHTRVIIAPRVGFGFGRGYWGWRGYPYPYPYYGYYSQYVFGDNEAAESQGYHDGLKTGQGDEHHGRSFDPERSHYFKDAGFGNFAEIYREGFERGYSFGFRT